MTDQRYTGPDGAKRLELLEKLARLVWPYLYGGSDMPTLEEMCDAIDDITWDNERVDRLEKKQPTSTRVALDFPLPCYTTRLK